MVEEEKESGVGETFWTAVSEAVDPTLYKPHRVDQVEAVRLKAENVPYFVIKQAEAKTYLRLSEADYALWWQMNGSKTVKDLLFYNLKRYHSLPIGHLNSLVANMREGFFLKDKPTDLYDQAEAELQARAPASRGERLLKGFLNTEIAWDGMDPFFTTLYKWTRWLFSWPVQLILLVIIFLGVFLYSRLFIADPPVYRLISGGWSVFTFFLANVIVIFFHEIAHGLTVKHVGRELNRGGFLIYWGLPAFFVDTRDTWLSSNEERIMVSWAGPHSGLLIGGLVGIFLAGVAYLGETAVSLPVLPILTSFIFQLGFVAYLSAFVNVNPLMELDGYFILMDWLDIPGLRQRAFRFWREDVWTGWQDVLRHPRQFWTNLNRNQRIFMAYGALAFIYSVYAFGFALYFWRSRLAPVVGILWNDYGWWGRALLLAVITAVVVPTVYYLFHYGWSRIHAGLEWLARRDLLMRVDVLALLVGVPLLIGIPALLIGIWILQLSYGEIAINTIVWFVFLTTIAAMIGIARQLPGSRFQWSVWSLVIAFSSITIAWIIRNWFPLVEELALIVAAGSVLAAGIVSWLTVQPDRLEMQERLLMATFFVAGMVMLVGTLYFGSGGWLTTLLILMGIIPGLIFLTPLLFNFWHSRFALPWLLLVLAIMLIPWLQFFPLLYVPVAILWLYAAALYLLLGVLAQFGRVKAVSEEEASFSERERLIDAFNHFMQAFFLSYEAVFGRRRLQRIYHEIIAFGPIDPDDDILTVAEQCRKTLAHAVDRLDDLAGTPFTQQAGQAAYDSLPWLEAETLGRHVLAEMEWGATLAQGFIQVRDRRRELIRQADIFAGFDEYGIDAVLAASRVWHGRSRMTIARAGEDATAFYLVESGQIGVFHEGEQLAIIEAGGYIGTMALLDDGDYMATYKTLTPVKALVLDRHRFDPLLRADTTLASQVSSGAQSRQLLKKMPLFSSLSPQQLAVIDAKLTSRRVKAGEIIVKKGEARTHLFIVANGRLEVLNESEQRIGTLNTGEHFGEYALFADVPYTATLRAAEDSELLLLDEPTFDNLVAEYERMSHYVEQIGSGRLLASRQRRGVTAVIS
jgi:putative peptide zinc metalloprotease protein